MEINKGDRILGYIVDGKIGTGSFGKVYHISKDNDIGKSQRALKVLTFPTQEQYQEILFQMGKDEEKTREHFRQELDVILKEVEVFEHLSGLDGQNIIRYYENRVLDQKEMNQYLVFILMEYATPLDKYMSQKSMTTKQVVQLGFDILNALKICHDNGVIHRDVKIENIFIGEQGNFKLGDFGVAKVFDNNGMSVSRKGTPNYIPPDVYLYKTNVDFSTDIYALGMVLYRLFNYMRIPFSPPYPQVFTPQQKEEAMNIRLTGRAVPPPVQASPALAAVITKALGSKGERYDTVDQFFEAWTQAVKSLSSEELEAVLGSGDNVKESGTGSSQSSYYNPNPFNPNEYGIGAEDETVYFKKDINPNVNNRKINSANLNKFNNANNPAGYESNGYNPNVPNRSMQNGNVSNQNVESRKSHTGLIAALIIVMVFAIGALGIVATTLILKNNKDKVAEVQQTQANAVNNNAKEESKTTVSEQNTQSQTATTAEQETETAQLAETMDYIGNDTVDYSQLNDTSDFASVSSEDGVYNFMYPKYFFEVGRYYPDEKKYEFIAADGNTTLTITEEPSEITDPHIWANTLLERVRGEFAVYTDSANSNNTIPYIFKSKEVSSSGFSRSIIGGPLSSDNSIGKYIIVAANSTTTYTMTYTYTIEDPYAGQSAIVFGPEGYMMDCLYRGWSISGSTNSPRSYTTYLSEMR